MDLPPPLENQPSESTLSYLVKLHEKRSAEFFPLSRVTNFADGRDIKIEPTKIKGAPFMLDNGAISLTAKNRDFLSSAESFCRAIRVLMHGYALVSMSDEKGNGWVSLENALAHISIVGNFPRANSKISHRMHAQVMDAESAVRTEWTKLAQNRPELNLSNIIEIVAQRHAIWPLASEFTKSTPSGYKGGKWPNDWTPARQLVDFFNSRQLEIPPISTGHSGKR